MMPILDIVAQLHEQDLLLSYLKEGEDVAYGKSL